MFGYDKRAFVFQTLLTWVVLLISYNAMDPEKSINWVFRRETNPNTSSRRCCTRALEMGALPLLLFLPTHLILLRLLG
jgi:hypothetical protein